MDEPSVDPSIAARAVDSFTDAKRAVDIATDEVVATSRKLARAVRRPTRGVGGALENLTRTAPLPMLGVAFILGLLLSGGRRRE